MVVVLKNPCTELGGAKVCEKQFISSSKNCRKKVQNPVQYQNLRSYRLCVDVNVDVLSPVRLRTLYLEAEMK